MSTDDDRHPASPDPDFEGRAPERDALHDRFEPWRTMATPAPIPVAQLRARRAPAATMTRRVSAVAAALVLLAVVSVMALRAAAQDDPTDVSTTSATSDLAPATTATTKGTTPTTAAAVPEPTTSVPTTVTPPVPPTTVAPLAPTTAPPVAPPTPTTTVPVEVVVPPPVVVPDGATIPDGMARILWSPAGTPPGPAATTIQINAQYSQCAGGASPDGHLHPPVVTETDDAVVITFWADPLGPPDAVYTCIGVAYLPGQAPVSWTVTLASPLGSRWVYDGFQYESNPPRLILDPNQREG